MYALNFAEEWGRTLYEFTKRLREELNDDLVMIVGLEENDFIYDSNVLVVVREKNDNIIRKVARIALEVNSKHKCSVNFYIADESAKNVVEAFLNYESRKEDCENSLREFKEKLMQLKEVLSLKEIDGYDSNVLVVVREKNDNIIRKVARIALEVNSKHKCSVNFYIKSEDEQN